MPLCCHPLSYLSVLHIPYPHDFLFFSYRHIECSSAHWSLASGTKCASLHHGHVQTKAPLPSTPQAETSWIWIRRGIQRRQRLVTAHFVWTWPTIAVLLAEKRDLGGFDDSGEDNEWKRCQSVYTFHLEENTSTLCKRKLPAVCVYFALLLRSSNKNFPYFKICLSLSSVMEINIIQSHIHVRTMLYVFVSGW